MRVSRSFLKKTTQLVDQTATARQSWSISPSRLWKHVSPVFHWNPTTTSRQPLFEASTRTDI